jgi:hypothetical protein
LDDLFKTTEEKIDEINDQGYDVKQMWGKIMVISPLLKWYVEHGLKVTQIHQVVEYTLAACFQKQRETHRRHLLSRASSQPLSHRPFLPSL